MSNQQKPLSHLCPLALLPTTRVLVHFLFLCVTLSSALPIVARSQQTPPLTITLTVRDAVGHFRFLNFGVHPNATYEFEKEFGEQLIPPIPPVFIFDARFADLPGRKRLGGTGSETDIRTYSSPSQLDTFIVRFQATETGLPLQFSWSSDVRDRCDSMRVVYLRDGKLISLEGTKVNTFELSDPSTTWLKIFLCGPWMKVIR